MTDKKTLDDIRITPSDARQSMYLAMTVMKLTCDEIEDVNRRNAAGTATTTSSSSAAPSPHTVSEVRGASFNNLPVHSTKRPAT